MAKNKADLIKKVAENAGISESAAAKQVENVLTGIVDVCKDIAQDAPNAKGIRGFLQLIGFGKFTVRHKAARNHRNPQTGEPVPSEAHEDVKFDSGKFFNDQINGKE